MTEVPSGSLPLLVRGSPCLFGAIAVKQRQLAAIGSEVEHSDDSIIAVQC